MCIRDRVNVNGPGQPPAYFGYCTLWSHVWSVKRIAKIGGAPPYGGNDTMIISKMVSTHPDRSSRSVGMVALKRMTCKKYKLGALECATFKTGHCIDCKSLDFRFPTIFASRTNDKYKKQFAKECVPHAFEGSMKRKALDPRFKCSEEDMEFFRAALVAF
eukprot:TRINITY_DN18722_c0_g2_i1.p1 TRINITY_DN18722_c0_g2~~TRINITY_DN18722_c0_g2_i1.p1  ORF type:complete len:160 (+),score=9.80 TRINITY_DN18722_c0_g2_i1:132-611(+)